MYILMIRSFQNSDWSIWAWGPKGGDVIASEPSRGRSIVVDQVYLSNWMVI